MNTRTGTSTRTCCTKPTKSKMLLSSLTLLGLVASVNAAQSMPYVRTKDLQGVADPENAKWISMSKDIDFLPVDDLPKKKRPSKRARSLENEEEEEDDAEYYADEDGDGTGEWEKYNPYSVQPFVEGMGDYDEYQQAWRLLGFMKIRKCSTRCAASYRPPKKTVPPSTTDPIRSLPLGINNVFTRP